MSSEDNTKRETSSESPEEDYGKFFFPERDEKAVKKTGWLKEIIQGRSSMKNTSRCISNVYSCIDKNPMVKLLISALKSQGCDFIPSRHVSCEDCFQKVNGGYDPENNQIVICKNNSTAENVCCSVLTHELIHMFDFCRAKADFKNLEHLACTEIRAASIMHCSFMSASADRDASFFNYKNRHQECAKRKAAMSVMLVRNISMVEAEKVVEKVFDKCYKDLEPFGRIPRRNSKDPERIFAEGYLYGYCEDYSPHKKS